MKLLWRLARIVAALALPWLAIWLLVLATNYIFGSEGRFWMIPVILAYVAVLMIALCVLTSMALRQALAYAKWREVKLRGNS